MLVAVNDDEQITDCAGSQLTWFGKDERSTVGLCQADAISAEHEEPFDISRIAVFALCTHARSE